MAKKISKKKQALRDSWDAILKKYEGPVFSKTKTKVSSKVRSMPVYSYRGQGERIASLETRVCDTAKKESPIYTGSSMIGIGQMAKSNAVPIFKLSDIIDLRHMRRS